MTSFLAPSVLPPLSESERAVIAQFSALYWQRWDANQRRGGEGTLTVGWLGHAAQKCPLDLWVYQEILVETTPDVIIECGTCLGGSTLFLASVCELLGRGRVVSIDIAEQPGRPQHGRIRYVHGDSAGADLVADVKRTLAPGERVMVILDSDHQCSHVLAELSAWANIVTPGCYLIVEDTLVNGHPVAKDFGPGPMEALRAFLQTRDDFVIDPARERFLLTLNPSGFLRRR